MQRKRKNSSNSGQALIITSLIITMLLLSTAYYVFEIDNNVASDSTAMDYAFQATKVSTVNTVVSSLASVSNGGDISVLETNLEMLASAVENHSYDGDSRLLFNPLNSSTYQDGIERAWGSNGLGISSAYVTFSLNASGSSVSYYSEYAVNVTTALTIEGSSTGYESEESVNVTCRVYDEQGFTLANNLTLLYQNETDGPWIPVSPLGNLNTIDYGNGTYFMTFNVYDQNVLDVSAQISDYRGIFVMASAPMQ
ncbi:MAG TPA: hypothetical protein VEH86_07950 [Candidatus Acidoferrum sp.]|nr:hypothetical protein [Candidatus Acidoferrum sp.]